MKGLTMTPDETTRLEEAARLIQDEVGAAYVELRDLPTLPGTIRDGCLVVFKAFGDREVSIAVSGLDCIQHPGGRLADIMEVRVRTAVKYAA
jgi:hypothetical protein